MKNSRSKLQKPISSTRNASRRRGFTLIEVIVALALFVVLMVVVFVPLTQATRFMSVGRTRSELQQAANSTMLQLQRDLSRAIYVYPNDNLPGITDKLPYTDNPDALSSTSYFPYVRSGAFAGIRGVGNTSRIDMILPEIDAGGNVKYPLTPAKYIVTYYARRFVTSKNYGVYETDTTNPLVLFRAQYPYVNANGTSVSPAVDTSMLRYAGSPGWLTQSSTAANRGEFDLEPYCADAIVGGLIPGSHAQITPRNVALVAPNATWPTPTVIPSAYNLVPNTTFTCADTNGDGKINQVTVNLTLTNFNRQVSGDGGNDSTKPVEGNLNFQKFTLMQSIDCPNVR